MRKLIVLLGAMFLLGTSLAFAEEGDIVVQGSVTTDTVRLMPVVSTRTVYTKSFAKNKSGNMAVMYKATSDGTVDVSIDLLQSFTRPTTECTLDERFVTTDTIVSSLTDENWHIATIDTLTPLPYALYKIVGNGSNDASTTVQIETGL